MRRGRETTAYGFTIIKIQREEAFLLRPRRVEGLRRDEREKLAKSPGEGFAQKRVFWEEKERTTASKKGGVLYPGRQIGLLVHSREETCTCRPAAGGEDLSRTRKKSWQTHPEELLAILIMGDGQLMYEAKQGKKA